MGLLRLRTLRSDARCCGGGSADRKEFLIKFLGFFFLFSLTIQYVMNAFLVNRHPVDRVPSKRASGEDIYLLHMRNNTISEKANAALSSVETPTPRTLAVPLANEETIHIGKVDPPNTLTNHTDRKSFPKHRSAAVGQPAQPGQPKPPEAANMDLPANMNHEGGLQADVVRPQAEVVRPPMPVFEVEEPAQPIIEVVQPAKPTFEVAKHKQPDQVSQTTQTIEVVNHAVLRQRQVERNEMQPDEFEIPASLLNNTKDEEIDSGVCPVKPPNLGKSTFILISDHVSLI